MTTISSWYRKVYRKCFTVKVEEYVDQKWKPSVYSVCAAARACDAAFAAFSFSIDSDISSSSQASVHSCWIIETVYIWLARANEADSRRFVRTRGHRLWNFRSSTFATDIHTCPFCKSQNMFGDSLDYYSCRRNSAALAPDTSFQFLFWHSSSAAVAVDARWAFVHTPSSRLHANCQQTSELHFPTCWCQFLKLSRLARRCCNFHRDRRVYFCSWRVPQLGGSCTHPI